MIRTVRNRLQFFLERLLLRGAHFRLLMIAALIGLVSMAGGGAAVYMTGNFASPSEGIWWAFLRLTDPGYLGDDQGLLLRVISTVVTVLGYVLFMGSLIAIMTQWLEATIRRLEAGLTPVSLNHHIVILGWTTRTPAIVKELVESETRVKRLLQSRGARRLRIAILSEEVTSDQHQALASFLGREWDARQVIFRSGNSLRNDHLKRVDYLHAAAIILPGADFSVGGTDQSDMRTIKTLLAIAGYAREESAPLPFVTAELFDARKIPVARTAYPGQLEILASDGIISLLVAQNIRHRRLSHIYTEILSYGEGNGIRIRRLPAFAGERFEDLFSCFPMAVPLGVLRPENGSFRPFLNPPPGFVVLEGDRLVIMARNHGDSNPDVARRPVAFPRGEFAPRVRSKKQRRILLLGWNDMIPALVHEFDNYRNEFFENDLFSAMSTQEREERLRRVSMSPERVVIRHLDGDYTDPQDLALVDLCSYDNIVLLGCDWMKSAEQADARTILGFMLLRNLLKDQTERPDILMEFLDPENQILFRDSPEEVILSPLILSHILSHVTLRPELNIVFQELFTSGGAEIYFQSSADYEVSGQMTFRAIQERVSYQGEIAIGLRIHDSMDSPGKIYLNPDKNQMWKLVDGDEVIVLSTDQ